MSTDNETLLFRQESTPCTRGRHRIKSTSLSLSFSLSLNFQVPKRFSPRGEARATVCSRHDAFPDTPYKCVLQGRDSHARETGRNGRRRRTERGTGRRRGESGCVQRVQLARRRARVIIFRGYTFTTDDRVAFQRPSAPADQPDLRQPVVCVRACVRAPRRAGTRGAAVNADACTS